MRKKAWITYNNNQNRLARMKARAKGTKLVNEGMTMKEASSGNSVIWCSACRGPVVDSTEARQRHGQKSEGCKVAMTNQFISVIVD